MDPNDIDMTVAAKSEREVAVAIKRAKPCRPISPFSCSCTGPWDSIWPTKIACRSVARRTFHFGQVRVDLIRTVAPEFEQPLSVAAVQPPKDFTLRYTMDGSAPTVASPLYERPLTVDDAATVKARFFNRAGHGTATSQQSYKPVPAGSGFRYRVYKGSWTRMPDFRKLTPIFEGVATDLQRGVAATVARQLGHGVRRRL